MAEGTSEISLPKYATPYYKQFWRNGRFPNMIHFAFVRDEHGNELDLNNSEICLLFEWFGKVATANRPKRIYYVFFVKPESVSRCIDAFQSSQHIHILRVEKKLQEPLPKKPAVAFELIMINIPPSFNERQVYETFEKYNLLAVSSISTLNVSPNLRYCHIYFKTFENAKQAQQNLDGCLLAGQRVIVDFLESLLVKHYQKVEEEEKAYIGPFGSIHTPTNCWEDIRKMVERTDAFRAST